MVREQDCESKLMRALRSGVLTELSELGRLTGFQEHSWILAMGGDRKPCG
jgi:hypothetical protein